MTTERENSKLKHAVAIRYDINTDAAPRVTAKGTGFIADQIIQLGNKYAIPVYQNKTLASMLMAIEIEQEIPPELYSAVAEVLAYIYRLDQNLDKSKK